MLLYHGTRCTSCVAQHAQQRELANSIPASVFVTTTQDQECWAETVASAVFTPCCLAASYNKGCGSRGVWGGG
jgi:hypothetical protein